MKNQLYKCLAVFAGIAAGLAAWKLVAGFCGLEGILNVASNCGAESAAAGAGAGALGCAEGDGDSYGPNTLADGGVSGIGGIGGNPNRSGPQD